MELMQLPGTNEIIAAVITWLRLEQLNHVIAAIEASWECLILSEEDEEELEQAWKVMKSDARAWRLKKESHMIVQV